MAHQFNLAAEPRRDAGKGASRRLRRDGKVPGIVYGGGMNPEGVALDSNALLRNMAEESFFSSILNVTLGGQTLQAIVRDYQVHPSKRVVLHIDLQRIVATEKIRINVPFHFINAATCKAVKDGGASVSHLMTEVEISCLPKDLPEYIELDLSAMNLNDSLYLNDITVPTGVTISALAHGANPPVVSIHAPRVAEPEPTAEAAEAAPAEGAVAAAPVEGAAGAKKEEGKKEEGAKDAKKEGGKK